MTITTIFDPPSPTDSTSVFNTKAFGLVAALNGWADEANDTASNVNADAASATANAASAATSAGDANTSKLSAAASASAAAASTGAALWVSGTTYVIGDARRSPASLRVYVRRTNGAGTTDPSADATNWALATAGGLPIITYTGTSATVGINERSIFTNVALVAVTLPATGLNAADEWIGHFDNGLLTNTVNLGGKSLTHNGVTKSGVITCNLPGVLRLVYDGTYWRFSS